MSNIVYIVPPFICHPKGWHVFRRYFLKSISYQKSHRESGGFVVYGFYAFSSNIAKNQSYPSAFRIIFRISASGMSFVSSGYQQRRLPQA